jgi:hypothetical protein
MQCRISYNFKMQVEFEPVPCGISLKKKNPAAESEISGIRRWMFTKYLRIKR